MRKNAVLWTLWPEIIGFSLLILGFLFSFSTIGSSFMSYIVIFLWGMMFGRLWYRSRKTFRFPLVIIISGFLVGFILASLIHGYGKPLILFLAYLAGIIVSNRLHSTKIIRGVDW